MTLLNKLRQFLGLEPKPIGWVVKIKGCNGSLTVTEKPTLKRDELYLSGCWSFTGCGDIILSRRKLHIDTVDRIITYY